jgi:hypothetical protein
VSRTKRISPKYNLFLIEIQTIVTDAWAFNIFSNSVSIEFDFKWSIINVNVYASVFVIQIHIESIILLFRSSIEYEIKATTKIVGHFYFYYLSDIR